ncbi:hypothetical protein [Anaerotruncus rubiinfantis]|uniref:hypothetical protein n=1 Tax=Anaerotruncus rubiinfantis TaxID=1720200 RepID=UPI00082D0D18|nr:hypothetical protein [Anaerotruncus rubiinfantis]
METTENTGAAAGLDVLKQQYETVSQALDYMGLVVAAVLVNYFTVFMQKEAGPCGDQWGGRPACGARSLSI